MAATWKDSAYRGSHFFESVLASEGMDASDPMALLRVKQAITDAQVWLWSQFDWFWAVSPNSPARFEIFPQTTVVKNSALGQKVLTVADTGELQADDTILIAEGVTDKEELAKIDSITAGVSLTLKENLIISHDADDAAIVRKLRPMVADPSVRTQCDDTNTAGSDTIDVEHTQNFTVNDFLILAPSSVPVAEEIQKIKAITIAGSSGRFTSYGNLDTTHATSKVYKGTESDPKFDLTLVNGGVMEDFGRATKVLIDNEGPLRPINRSRWRATREDRMSGGVGIGDAYVIEGNPPEIKFEITPTSNKTVVVHYLRAPTLVAGDDDIQPPFAFHNLLRWLSRSFLLKNGPAGGSLLQDADVMAELERLKGFSLDLSQVVGMRPLNGLVDSRIMAGVPGAAVLKTRFDDFL